MVFSFHFGRSTRSGANLWQKVEVRLARNATVRFNVVRQAVQEFITTSFGSVIWLSTVIEGWETNPILESSVERIYASESSYLDKSIPVARADLQIHVFQPYPDDTYDECTGGEGEEEIVSATVAELPSRNLEGLWESLIFTDGIKLNLLDYISATIFLGDADVDCEYNHHDYARGRPDYMRLILIM